MIENPKKLTRLLDTDSGPRPGDFVLGSTESRAAARAMLAGRDEPKDRVRVLIVHIGSSDLPTRCTRTLSKDGLLIEFVYGMPDQELYPWTEQQIRAFIEKHPIQRDSS